MLIRTTRAILGSLAFLWAASPGAAADLAEAYGPVREGVERRATRAVIVVPDCEERLRAKLLGCLPRGELAWAEDVELSQILRTVNRPRRMPYPQLVDRP